MIQYQLEKNLNREIVKGHILIVKTPKYIGYQMARFKRDDRTGQLDKVAWQTKHNGFWNFVAIEPAEFMPMVFAP